MDLPTMRTQLGDTQSEFSRRYSIPFRTIQNWETGLRKPPDYMLSLLESRIKEDLMNHKTVVLPKYDPHKPDLPKRKDFIGAVSWLKAVQDCLGEKVVFALDEALMCQGLFAGRSHEYIVWLYGSDRVTCFNGVVVLGDQIPTYNVEENNGLKFTDLNRTLYDALTNETILDMQGITEAVSRYYYSNNESFRGIFVAPIHQERFEVLAKEAVDYYGS